MEQSATARHSGYLAEVIANEIHATVQSFVIRSERKLDQKIEFVFRVLSSLSSL
jgi:uncharacterized membrane protein